MSQGLREKNRCRGMKCKDIIIILYISIEPSIGKCPRGDAMSQGERTDVGTLL